MRSVVNRSGSLLALAAALVLSACGGASARVAAPSSDPAKGPAGDYPMVLGAPFLVDGVTYTPADTLNYDSVGYAQSAAGQGVSGAHRTLPLPSYVEVTSLETGRTILVRLTQRGPMTGADLLSLSPAAWSQLGATPGGRLPVRVRRVNPPEAERALLREGGQAPARMDTPPGLLAALKRKLGLPAVAAPVPDPAPVPVARPLPAKPLPVEAKAKEPATPEQKMAPAKPSPAPAKAAPPASAATPPAASASVGKALYVQVGAYSTRERAEAVAKRIGGAVSAAGKYWRVRTGPHKDRGQADAALAKARAGGYADAKVVPAP
ncbi:SPOR domain-containing protein [Novosphingobium sp. B1]|uniref:SPOR domain-containing protein n=1 Tax=Novosphingobium sp. B1 TaxID=1938756 RepID=UPI000A033D71|nr:SPOR domain-containing protein [Novosphingobium sp. B1]